MKSKKFKRAISFLILIVLTFTFCLTAFGESVTGENYFGYNTSVKEVSGNETVFGFIMWAVLSVFILLLVLAAVYNGIRLIKEEKERRAAEKPKLIIKKGYKN